MIAGMHRQDSSSVTMGTSRSKTKSFMGLEIGRASTRCGPHSCCSIIQRHHCCSVGGWPSASARTVRSSLKREMFTPDAACRSRDRRPISRPSLPEMAQPVRSSPAPAFHPSCSMYWTSAFSPLNAADIRTVVLLAQGVPWRMSRRVASIRVGVDARQSRNTAIRTVALGAIRNSAINSSIACMLASRRFCRSGLPAPSGLTRRMSINDSVVYSKFTPRSTRWRAKPTPPRLTADPYLPSSSTLAPAENNLCAISKCPPAAASCMAVTFPRRSLLPVLASLLTSAPRASSKSTASSCPWRAARCRGVTCAVITSVTSVQMSMFLSKKFSPSTAKPLFSSISNTAIFPMAAAWCVGR